MLLVFANNTAINSGNDIYGASPKECTSCSMIDRVSSSISSVSSEPLRICVCVMAMVYLSVITLSSFMSQKIYPGEIFTVPAVIVGWDSNATIGIVYANHLTTMNSVTLDSYILYVITDDCQCINLTFSLLSGLTNVNVMIYITGIHMDTQLVLDYAPNGNCSVQDLDPNSEDYRYCIHTIPVFYQYDTSPLHVSQDSF